jgi:two-component system phosphate regulon response regulator PhoB
MNPYVLVVDDEDALAVALEYNLGKEGFRVARVVDGESAVAAPQARPPDLIVLDWILPRMSGLDVCRTLREHKATRLTPILMLTARGAEEDKLAGLSAGADDYLVKPFGMSELVARLRALLRRARPELFEERLECGDVVLDQAGRRVTRSGRDIKLGPTEFKMLEFLMRAPGRVFSRERLKAAIWGPDLHVEDRTVNPHMGRLRRSLRLPRRPDVIRTVRAAGYALDIRERA